MLALSVVIATYKRSDTLKVTLECLSRQTLAADRFEVVVVDDGSPDDTPAMVESVIPRVPYTLRYYRHSNRGPGATENRGIREAAADLVLLIADDIQPGPHLLEAHVAAHQNRPGDAVAILGRVLQSPALPKTHFQSCWDPFKFRNLTHPVELPYLRFWACNISVSRQFLLQNGLFTELKGAAHEDVELGYRLSQKGLRIFYEPEALAYHYHVETLASACARAYERGLNWRFIEDYVPDPQIRVAYHTPAMFRSYSAALQVKPNILSRSDRSFSVLAAKQLLRWVAFNRLSVEKFWLPVLLSAESNRVSRLFANAFTYRMVAFHHFYKGCCEQAASHRVTAGSSATRQAGIPPR